MITLASICGVLAVAWIAARFTSRQTICTKDFDRVVSIRNVPVEDLKSIDSEDS